MASIPSEGSNVNNEEDEEETPSIDSCHAAGASTQQVELMATVLCSDSTL
jgi:hypothetical protein